VNDCSSVGPGGIRFYDNYVPALPAGDYLVNVTQQVNPAGTDIDDCYAASQAFSVAGPRYSLPPEDVYSVFPPSNAAGIFDQFLPHVVFTKRELPWERNVFGDTDPAEQTPWVALLLFAPGDLLAPDVSGWTPNATMSAAIAASELYDHPTGDGTLWPDLEQEWYEQGLSTTTCAIVDLSPAAFTTLVPAKGDLRYLAHARQVDASGKADDILRVSGDGWYSVVVANRLPVAPAARSVAPGPPNVVHLLSLEGFEPYVGGEPLPAGTTRVRMISLQRWTFTCLPELGESFSELANGLLANGTRFALPAQAPPNEPQAVDDAAAALADGYSPLAYQTRLGEQTFAWCRGPLSPVPVANFVRSQQGPDVQWQPFGTASAALVYDPSYGVFDVSYGVAWETGRLLALSDAAFAGDLANWERDGHRLIDLILERKAQIPALGSFDPDDPDPVVEQDLLSLIQSYAVTDDFMTYLVTQLSEQIAPTLYDQPPTPPEPPFPPYPAPPSPPVNPQTIADLLAESDVQEAVRALGAQGLETIADWLARRYLLVGVPFEALVPHPALLPPESIRFFYCDSNWLDTLLEGALSIGVDSSRDRFYQDLMKDLIWDTTLDAVQDVRNQLLGVPPVPVGSEPPVDPATMTGMLLRSALVSGWPGLEVHAYAQTQFGSFEPDLATAIPLLRMDRLGSDLLLCLWPAVPAVVTVDEPQEGIAFGFEDPPTGEGDWLYLRSLDANDYGISLCPDPTTCAYAIDARASGVIDPETRLVKVDTLLAAIQAKLPGDPVLAVRDLAIELVKVPEQAVFAAAPEIASRR
jgi:hypothetical protein